MKTIKWQTLNKCLRGLSLAVYLMNATVVNAQDRNDKLSLSDFMIERFGVAKGSEEENALRSNEKQGLCDWGFEISVDQSFSRYQPRSPDFPLDKINEPSPLFLAGLNSLARQKSEKLPRSFGLWYLKIRPEAEKLLSMAPRCQPGLKFAYLYQANNRANKVHRITKTSGEWDLALMSFFLQDKCGKTDHIAICSNGDIWILYAMTILSTSSSCESDEYWCDISWMKNLSWYMTLSQDTRSRLDKFQLFK